MALSEEETQAMKKFLIPILAASTLTAVALPAAAAPWMSINQRQVELDRRIDAGVRRGDLTRSEAYQLRTEFRSIAMLESRYRHTGGLQLWEIRDLDRRFDTLSARIRYERHDRDGRRGGHGPRFDRDHDGVIDRYDRYPYDPRRS